jgi:hypothetical protein
LETELKMQKAKVELIKSLEKDIDKFEHLANIEVNTSDLKEKINEGTSNIKDKIESKKTEIKEKLNKEE